MKPTNLFFAVLFALCANQSALADPQEEKPTTTQSQIGKPGTAPQMSEIPVMQEQGQRMATMMEKLTHITDPAERKRILAEAMCPQ